MDDVMCAIAYMYASEHERRLAECMMVLLRSTYPYPLDLQWEERSKRYNFLEMEVVTSKQLLWSR